MELFEGTESFYGSFLSLITHIITFQIWIEIKESNEFSLLRFDSIKSFLKILKFFEFWRAKLSNFPHFSPSGKSHCWHQPIQIISIKIISFYWKVCVKLMKKAKIIIISRTISPYGCNFNIVINDFFVFNISTEMGNSNKRTQKKLFN